VLNGRPLRAAVATAAAVVVAQAREKAIRDAVAETNALALATWPPGRLRALADTLTRYASGSHARHSARIATQLLFGRRSLVHMYAQTHSLRLPTEWPVTPGTCML
jgi:hypothetical protein